MTRKSIIITTLTFIVIGAIPYLISLSSYSSGTGFIGDGVGYAYSDKSHYDSFQIVYFDSDESQKVTVNKGIFYFNGNPIKSKERSFFLNKDGSTQPIEFTVEDYRTSTNFSSNIVGIFGPVPHFKDYQIESPKATIRSKIPLESKNISKSQ